MYHTCGRFSSYVGKEVRRNIEVLMTLILGEGEVADCPYYSRVSF